MEDISLIDFLKIEVYCFRELLSSLIAEEMAYREAALSRLSEISLFQKELLGELKNKHPKKFQPFKLHDDVDHALLNNLKSQLETLVGKVTSQYARLNYIKTLTPLTQEKEVRRQIKIDTLEDQC